MVYHKTDKVIEKQQSRKKRILNAAKALLADKEIGGASVKAIARKAGIATGTFYLYFKDKDTLLDMLVNELYKELLEVIKNERAGYDNGFDKLEATMRACIKTFMNKKHLARIMLDISPQNNSVFNTKFSAIVEELVNFTKTDLDELLKENLIPEQDTKVSATAFVGAFREVILSWIYNLEPIDQDLAYRTLIDYNMRGLGKK